MCDAEERNKQALYILKNDWGSGRVDVGRIMRILDGGRGPYTNDCEEPTHARTG